MKISRQAYAEMFGATTGDRVRLADTELVIEVERDFTVYGDEIKFGGGKVIRDGMGQSQRSRAEGAMDTVITNALIIDHIHNHYLPQMEVDAQTYQVRADGQLLSCDPLAVVPMAQRYFLF